MNNYRITDILSFHMRDVQGIAENVNADRLHKGIIWQGSPACLTLRFLSQRAEIKLNIDHPPTSIETGGLSELTVRMLGLNPDFPLGISR